MLKGLGCSESVTATAVCPRRRARGQPAAEDRDAGADGGVRPQLGRPPRAAHRRHQQAGGGHRGLLGMRSQSGWGGGRTCPSSSALSIACRHDVPPPPATQPPPHRHSLCWSLTRLLGGACPCSFGPTLSHSFPPLYPISSKLRPPVSLCLSLTRLLGGACPRWTALRPFTYSSTSISPYPTLIPLSS
jgi:hypothetical protein